MIGDDEDDDHGTYMAFVSDVADPLGLHRIRFSIPGKMALSDWSWPRHAGGPRRGGHIVPHVGDMVVIEFIDGNKDLSTYTNGWWAQRADGKTAPVDLVAAGNQAHLVQAFEIGDIGGISFRATLDERVGRRSCRVYAIDTVNNLEIVSLELDLEKRGIVIYGLTGIVLQSDGYIQATAPIVQINDRAVQTKGGPV